MPDSPYNGDTTQLLGLTGRTGVGEDAGIGRNALEMVGDQAREGVRAPPPGAIESFHDQVLGIRPPAFHQSHTTRAQAEEDFFGLLKKASF